MTGDKIGDAVEAEALAKTFGKSRTCEPILVGSIKTNIGHTEAVSGLAAVIKTVFTLQRGQIAPNTNYDKLNPNFRQEEWNLRVSSSDLNQRILAGIDKQSQGSQKSHPMATGPTPSSFSQQLWLRWNQCTCHSRGDASRWSIHERKQREFISSK